MGYGHDPELAYLFVLHLLVKVNIVALCVKLFHSKKFNFLILDTNCQLLIRIKFFDQFREL